MHPILLSSGTCVSMLPPLRCSEFNLCFGVSLTAFGNATNATYALAAVSGATDYINTYVGDDTDVSIFWETATQTGEIFLLLAAGAVRCLVLYNVSAHPTCVRVPVSFLMQAIVHENDRHTAG